MTGAAVRLTPGLQDTTTTVRWPVVGSRARRALALLVAVAVVALLAATFLVGRLTAGTDHPAQTIVPAQSADSGCLVGRLC